MLLRHMTYFREQLDQKNRNGLEKGMDVEISVHCEIKIFDWLMRYLYLADKVLVPQNLKFANEILNESIQPVYGEQLLVLKKLLLEAPQESPKHQRISILQKLKQESTMKSNQDIPPLRVRNALSLALSSDHLGIPELKNMCLEVMSQNLEEVVKMPVEMASLGDSVLSSLAQIASAESLQALNDEKDRLTSLIYKYKVNQLLEEQQFLRCGACRKVYCAKNRDLLWCNLGRGEVLENGQLISRHIEGPELKIQDFKDFLLKESFFTQRELYWKLWGCQACVRCSSCDHYFPLTEYNMCFFHPQPLMFQESSSIVFMARHFGVYRCCLRRAFRFDPFLKHEGCARRDHQPDLSDPEDRRLWNLFIPHMSKIREYSSISKSPLRRKARTISNMGDEEDNRDYIQQIMITPEPLGKKSSVAVRIRLGSEQNEEGEDQNLQYEGMSLAFALQKYLGEFKQYASSKDVIIKNLQKQKKAAASIKSPRVKKIHKTLATLNRNVLKLQGFAVERAALLQKLKKKLSNKRTRNVNLLDLQYGMSSTQERKMQDARDNRRRQDGLDMDQLSQKLREMRQS